MKRIIFTALLLGMLSAGYADGILSSKCQTLLSKPHTVVYDRIMSDGTTRLQVANITDGGFVLTQGERVLGYSETGSFLPECAPPAMLDLLQSLQNVPSDSKEQAQLPIANALQPLLGDIAWNQDSPYNDLCPLYNMSSRCPTGCVATAMAQLMYYHHWPLQGSGQHSYSPAIMSGNVLSADFGATTYQWDAMLPNYASSTVPANGYTMEQSREAVSLLMLHCGIAVDMVYYSQSGATDYDVPPALITYFNYDRSMAYRKREHYSTAEWLQIIHDEIAEGRPVLAYGRATSGGHAYVFDGIDEQGFIHVNWGWGGMSNGYFQTSALTPASQGIGGSDGGFNYSQRIITSIRPADGTLSDYAVELTSTEGLTVNKNKTAQNSDIAIRLSGKVINHGWRDSSFDYALLLLSEAGDTMKVIAGPTSQTLAKDATAYAPSFGTVNLGTLPAGEYTLYPACRMTGGTGRWLRIHDNYIGYVNRLDITATDDELSFRQPDYFLLKANNIELPEQIYSNVPTLITATVKNEGDVEYHGEVKAQLRQGSSIVSSTSNYIVDLLPGDSTLLRFTDSFNAAAGSYTLCLVDDDGAVISSRIQTTVKPQPAMGSVRALTQLSVGKADYEQLEATVTVSADEGFFAGLLYTFIFSSDSKMEVGCLFPQYILLNGNQQQVTMTGTFENGQPGKTYQAVLAIYDGTSYTFLTDEHATTSFLFDPDHTYSGIRSVDSGTNGDAAPVFDLQGRRTNGAHRHGLLIKNGKIIINTNKK